MQRGDSADDTRQVLPDRRYQDDRQPVDRRKDNRYPRPRPELQRLQRRQQPAETYSRRDNALLQCIQDARGQGDDSQRALRTRCCDRNNQQVHQGI